MIAAVGCLVFALACQNVDRAQGPTTTLPIGSVATSPPVLLSLTCMLDRSSTTISCKPTRPSPAATVSASVIYGSTATYGAFFPYNLVKDTVAHTWTFTAQVQNLLKQSIGTLNGTTMTGVKVYVTDFHATVGAGTVSVASADGTGNFTAPNQPYFNYNQIIAPSGYSGNKLWKFNVPNTVTAVSMSILISADFPAEQGVTLTPRDTNPAWFQADSSWRGSHMKRVLTVIFQDGAALADRQLAIAYVNGTIVGGVLGLPGNEGIYNINIPGDGSDTAATNAVSRIQALPQVKEAMTRPHAKAGHLKHVDGATWRSWSLICALARESTVISCKPALPSPAAGVSASVIRGDTATYARFLSHGFLKDTVAQTWIFTANVQNLLEQSIGTLNGTTVTGVKVIVADVRATDGRGAVSVANADGTGNFTAPNQPYFNYDQIVTPSGYSGNKLWKFNVPNTVTSASMRILISTHFPAEQNVTALPPATRPAWFNDDSSWAGPYHDDYLKRVITLCFKDGTTLQDRQLAVGYVNGTVVGGEPLSSGDGCYFVKVADDGSGAQLGAAISRLKGLSQVEVAAPTFAGSPGSRGSRRTQ